MRSRRPGNAPAPRKRRIAPGTLTLSVFTTCVTPAVAPTPQTTDGFADVRAYLGAAVDSGAFPGGVLVVGHRGRIALAHAFGRYGENDARPVSDSTIYDLASLTKVIGLTTAAMMLAADGRLELDAPVQRYLPAFQGPGKDAVRVRHLLLHASGLPAWRPLYSEASDAEAALALTLETPLDTAAGTRYVYSDLGAIVLTQVVTRVAGERLDHFLAREVFAPLAMTSTRFLPPEEWRDLIAPTERDPWRGRELRGEVHDENAARLGGVSGHAGLFAPATDLARFAFWLLDAYHARSSQRARPAVPASVVRAFVRGANEPPPSSRALGWDTPSTPGSGGRCLSPNSFGHTGFTGTSLWIDPEREIAIILLTNRVHPTRENPAIRTVRPAVADLVMSALLGEASCPAAR